MGRWWSLWAVGGKKKKKPWASCLRVVFSTVSSPLTVLRDRPARSGAAAAELPLKNSTLPRGVVFPDESPWREGEGRGSSHAGSNYPRRPNAKIYSFTAELHREEEINFRHIASSVVWMLWLIRVLPIRENSELIARLTISHRPGKENKPEDVPAPSPNPTRLCKLIKRWQPSCCIDICTIIIILPCM